MINIIITLCVIGLIVYIFQKIYSEIENESELNLFSKITSIFVNSENRPLYKVFYGFNHSSAAAWSEWIKTQDSEKQNEAFENLDEYLKQAPAELGSILEK